MHMSKSPLKSQLQNLIIAAIWYVKQCALLNVYQRSRCTSRLRMVQVPLKSRYAFTRLSGVTFQAPVIIIITAVRISDLSGKNVVQGALNGRIMGRLHLYFHMHASSPKLTG